MFKYLLIFYLALLDLSNSVYVFAYFWKLYNLAPEECMKLSIQNSCLDFIWRDKRKKSNTAFASKSIVKTNWRSWFLRGFSYPMANLFVSVYNGEIFVRKILSLERLRNRIFLGSWKNIYKIIDNGLCYVKRNRKSAPSIGTGR